MLKAKSPFSDFISEGVLIIGIVLPVGRSPGFDLMAQAELQPVRYKCRGGGREEDHLLWLVWWGL